MTKDRGARRQWGIRKGEKMAPTYKRINSNQIQVTQVLVRDCVPGDQILDDVDLARSTYLGTIEDLRDNDTMRKVTWQKWVNESFIGYEIMSKKVWKVVKTEDGMNNGD